MKGHEARSLMESRPLGLLEDHDAVALADHLDGCEVCGRQAEALDAAYADLTVLVDQDEAERSWSEGLRARILTAAGAAEEEGGDSGMVVGAAASSAAVDKAKAKGPAVPPAAPTPDAQALGIKVKLTCVDGELTVRCNGRKTATKRFKANELRGAFGMVAKDVRLQITSLKITGQVDTSALD